MGFMSDSQHFFLSAAGENTELAHPRECWEIKRMKDGVRDDYMLINIEPPYREPSGIGYGDVYKLILATKFKGDSLYPIRSWPCHVYVFMISDEKIEAELEFRAGQVRIVAWGMLFQTLAEAESHAKRFS
jgi:hypothetical protein